MLGNSLLHIFQYLLVFQCSTAERFIIYLYPLLINSLYLVQSHNSSIAHNTYWQIVINPLVNAKLLHKRRQSGLHLLIFMKFLYLLFHQLLMDIHRMRQQLYKGGIIQTAKNIPLKFADIVILSYITKNGFALIGAILFVNIGQIHHMGTYQIKFLIRIFSQYMLRHMHKIVTGIAVSLIIQAKNIQHNSFFVQCNSPLNTAQQYIWVKWLGHKIRSPILKAFCLLLRGTVAGQNQHRNHIENFILLKFLQKGITIHNRHIQIQQNGTDLGTMLAKIVQSLLTIGQLHSLIISIQKIA